MQRRFFLLAPLAGRVLAADPASEIFDLFTKVATSLSAAEPAPVLQVLDPAMPGYQTLVQSITALTAQSDIICSIDVLVNEGDNDRRKVELDWFLQLTSPGAPLIRRRERVKGRLERRGKKKKWIIVQLEPVSFFAPVRVK
jgi:hypothetical protein